MAKSETPEAAGTFEETATFTANGTKIICSSGTPSWSVTRASPPTQPPGVGSAGSYKVTESQNGNPGSFTVSSSRTTMKKLDISLVGLGCNPGDGGVSTSIVLGSLKLSKSGSFSTTYDQTSGNVTYRITFDGHFHGVDSSGNSRAAGSYLVTGTYTSKGTVYSCSSNKQYWYAVLIG